MMNKEDVLGAFSLVNNPIVLSEEEVKDVQKAIKELQQENNQLKQVNEEHQKLNGELREYCKQLKEILNEIKNIDVFKEFSFPLMKRWEEQQVLSSIDYQFKNTFIKKIQELEKSDSNE